MAHLVHDIREILKDLPMKINEPTIFLMRYERVKDPHKHAVVLDTKIIVVSSIRCKW